MSNSATQVLGTQIVFVLPIVEKTVDFILITSLLPFILKSFVIVSYKLIILVHQCKYCFSRIDHSFIPLGHVHLLYFFGERNDHLPGRADKTDKQQFIWSCVPKIGITLKASPDFIGHIFRMAILHFIN